MYLIVNSLTKLLLVVEENMILVIYYKLLKMAYFVILQNKLLTYL